VPRKCQTTRDLLPYLLNLGVDLDEMQAKLLDRYADLVRERGKTLNLVSAADAERVMERHVADSLAGAPLIPAGTTAVVDIGTGAGFPGIPLAIAHPETRFVLVDRTRKRVAFLMHVAQVLGLSNAEAVWSPVEKVFSLPGMPDAFDVATVRAVADTGRALELARPLLAEGGIALLWQSPEQDRSEETPAGWTADWVPVESPDGIERGIRVCRMTADT
jgi:16S rRNA (guanine527-N7)-methyltransferase